VSFRKRSPRLAAGALLAASSACRSGWFNGRQRRPPPERWLRHAIGKPATRFRRDRLSPRRKISGDRFPTDSGDACQWPSREAPRQRPVGGPKKDHARDPPRPALNRVRPPNAPTTPPFPRAAARRPPDHNWSGCMKSSGALPICRFLFFQTNPRSRGASFP